MAAKVAQLQLLGGLVAQPLSAASPGLPAAMQLQSEGTAATLNSQYLAALPGCQQRVISVVLAVLCRQMADLAALAGRVMRPSRVEMVV